MISPEEARWWSAFVERVSAEARSRGGSVYLDKGLVRLVPPNAAGEPIEVVQFVDDGMCRLTAGLLVSVMSFYTDYEDHNGVLQLVLAVMEGGAQEIVDVAADGRWLGVRTVIEHAGGARRSGPRPSGAYEVLVEHSHVRVIEAWGPPVTA